MLGYGLKHASKKLQNASNTAAACVRSGGLTASARVAAAWLAHHWFNSFRPAPRFSFAVPYAIVLVLGVMLRRFPRLIAGQSAALIRCFVHGSLQLVFQRAMIVSHSLKS